MNHIRGGLGLTDEDIYLEIHVPDSVKGAPRAVLGVFKEGAVALADFLIEKRLSPRCVPRLATATMAHSQAFDNAFLPIGDAPTAAVHQQYDRASPTSRWWTGPSAFE